MSFWNLSTGETIEESKTFDQGGVELIPHNTVLQAYIEEVKWTKGFETDAEYINVRWRVLAPQAYANRVVFQKLWVNGDNPSKEGDKAIKQGDAARTMLRAIDANCGGNLSKNQSIPSDQDLQSNLLQKPMNIKVLVWDVGGNKGNWVSAVSPRSAVAEPVKAAPVVKTTAEAIGDEIPF